MSREDDFYPSIRSWLGAADANVVTTDQPITTPYQVFLAGRGGDDGERPQVATPCIGVNFTTLGLEEGAPDVQRNLDGSGDPQAYVLTPSSGTVTLVGWGEGAREVLEAAKDAILSPAVDAVFDAADFDVVSIGPILFLPVTRETGVEPRWVVDVEITYIACAGPFALVEGETVNLTITEVDTDEPGDDPDPLVITGSIDLT